MLSESVANEKDTAAGAGGKGSLRASPGDGGKTAIELAKRGARSRTVSLRKGCKCQVELGAHAELGRHAA